MLVHCVMFAFKEESMDRIQPIKAALEALPQHIPTLVSMEVGIDVSRSERSLEMILISHFQSQADLDAYATHPAHLHVVEAIKAATHSTKVVDYWR